jgi:hypothetical protein
MMLEVDGKRMIVGVGSQAEGKEAVTGNEAHVFQAVHRGGGGEKRSSHML